MPEPGKLVMVHLRRIDEEVDCVIDDRRDIKSRVTNLAEGQARIQRRLDRVDARLDRIERRLDLVELPH
jgi:septation ring formation regulator EzrA